MSDHDECVSTRRLNDLMAVIHRDGGHHRAAVGDEQAWKDAMQRVCDERAERDALRNALADADVLAEYTSADGRRQWAVAQTWLYPGECLAKLAQSYIDAAMQEGK